MRERGAVTADYVFCPGIDEPLIQRQGVSVYYYNVDGLGSTTMVNFDAIIPTHNNYVYDAWGVLRSTSGSIPNTFGYTSREFAEAGLMYYRARYYNPSIGRFGGEDPLKNAVNFYTYGGNDPLSFNDPSGLMEQYVAIKDNPIPTEDILSVCPDYAGGSCIDPASIKYRFSCNCDECVHGLFRPNAKATVLLDIYIFSGDWKEFKRKNPSSGCDRTVEDFESAYAHEFSWHINKAKRLLKHLSNSSTVPTGEQRKSVTQFASLFLGRSKKFSRLG